MSEAVKKFVGKRAVISAGGLMVEVEVTDVRMSWGRMQYQVAPVAGNGSVWVETISLI